MRLVTSEHIVTDFESMRRWHARRSFQSSIPPKLRRFHRRAAKEISMKLNHSGKAAWNWKSFIESVRANCQQPTEGEFLHL